MANNDFIEGLSVQHDRPFPQRKQDREWPAFRRIHAEIRMRIGCGCTGQKQTAGALTFAAFVQGRMDSDLSGCEPTLCETVILINREEEPYVDL